MFITNKNPLLTKPFLHFKDYIDCYLGLTFIQLVLKLKTTGEKKKKKNVTVTAQRKVPGERGTGIDMSETRTPTKT